MMHCRRKVSRCLLARDEDSLAVAAVAAVAVDQGAGSWR